MGVLQHWALGLGLYTTLFTVANNTKKKTKQWKITTEKETYILS